VGTDETKSVVDAGPGGGRSDGAGAGPGRAVATAGAATRRTKTLEAVTVPLGPWSPASSSTESAAPPAAPTVDDPALRPSAPAARAPAATTVYEAALAARAPGGAPPALTPSPPVARIDMTRLPNAGESIGGRYALRRTLGEGAFGRVFEAENVETSQKVALKVVGLRRYPREYANLELRALAAIAHPNVVQLNEYGVESDAAEPFLWYTMPFYRGHDLAAELARGPLRLRDAHAVFVRIVGGLCELHGAGLRHQDVKPENIYLAKVAGADERHPVLLDLGGAACVGQGRPLVATLPFAAPEQTEALLGAQLGERPEVELTTKVDVYAAAATLLYGLVGARMPGAHLGRRSSDERAFASREGLGRLRDELRAAHRARAADPLPAGTLPAVDGPVRARLAAAFRAWLALDPAERPDAPALLAQLGVLLEWDAELARRAAADAERRRGRRQQRVVTAVTGGALATLLTGGWAGYAWGERLEGERDRAASERDAHFVDLEQCQKTFARARAKCAEEKGELGEAARQCQRELKNSRAGAGECAAQCAHQKNELLGAKKRALDAERLKCAEAQSEALAEAAAECEASKAAAITAATTAAQAHCAQETAAAVAAAKAADEQECSLQRAASAKQCAEGQAVAVAAAKADADEARRTSLERAKADCDAATRAAAAEAKRACVHAASPPSVAPPQAPTAPPPAPSR
jgi:hypothetical protein